MEFVENIEVSSLPEALAYLVYTVAKGNEGAIIKAASEKWKNTKPAYQIKLKLVIDGLDLKLVGGNFGKANSKNRDVISSLNVESSCGFLKASPAGMSEEVMRWVTENMENLKGSIVKVKCNGVSKIKHGEWSLLHPCVEEFRTDKVVADSLEECLAQHEAAIALNQ